VRVDGFWIDRHEVTKRAVFGEFVTATGIRQTRRAVRRPVVRTIPTKLIVLPDFQKSTRGTQGETEALFSVRSSRSPRGWEQGGIIHAAKSYYIGWNYDPVALAVAWVYRLWV